MNDDGFSPSDLFGHLDEETWFRLARLAEMGLSVAALVHEARQPLSSVQMALQLLAESTELPEDASSYLEDARQGITRLEGLLETGRSFLQPGSAEQAEHDLAELVVGVLSFLAVNLKQRGVEVETVVEPGLPLVRIDRPKVEQLLFNLLINAGDAVRGNGGGRVVVHARRDGRDGVMLVVADDGPGIDPEVAERVFDPFFTTKGPTKGTGLGLFIARRIAELHDSSLELLTESERGALDFGPVSTAFSARLPAAVESEAPPPEKSKKRHRALLVDDEDMIRKLVARALETEGIGCLGTPDGEQAVKFLEIDKFDILIVDKNLPGITGLEVARFARSIRPTMPILLITGYASERSAIEAASLGVADYVLKPLDVNDLRMRVNKLLDPDAFIDDRGTGDGERSAERPTIPPPRRGADEDEPAEPTVEAEVAQPSGEQPPLPARVLIIEEDTKLRHLLTEVLSRAGCNVAAFATPRQAEAQVRSVGYEILVAGPDVLRAARDWLADRSSSPPLGAVAIMDRGGVDKAIEAIHLGARGVLAPPFEQERVTSEFRRAVVRLLEESEVRADAFSERGRR